jgi:hypothetical protein
VGELLGFMESQPILCRVVFLSASVVDMHADLQRRDRNRFLGHHHHYKKQLIFLSFWA